MSNASFIPTAEVAKLPIGASLLQAFGEDPAEAIERATALVTGVRLVTSAQDNGFPKDSATVLIEQIEDVTAAQIVIGRGNFRFDSRGQSDKFQGETWTAASKRDIRRVKRVLGKMSIY